MPYTEKEKLEFDMNCYGMPRQKVREYLEPQAKMVGKNMLIMSMLSDAQHLIEHDQKEEARKLINRTKWAHTNLEETELDKFLKEREQQQKELDAQKEKENAAA